MREREISCDSDGSEREQKNHICVKIDVITMASHAGSYAEEFLRRIVQNSLIKKVR